MDLEKKYEKKKAQVRKLRDELDYQSTRIDAAVSELEEIKREYEEELQKTKNCRKEYEILISQLRILRKAMNVNQKNRR